MNKTQLSATLETEQALEELRRAYWHLINVRDTMRYHTNPRLNLAAFRINEATDIVASVLMRQLEEWENN